MTLSDALEYAARGARVARPQWANEKWLTNALPDWLEGPDGIEIGQTVPSGTIYLREPEVPGGGERPTWTPFVPTEDEQEATDYRVVA